MEKNDIMCFNVSLNKPLNIHSLTLSTLSTLSTKTIEDKSGKTLYDIFFRWQKNHN